MALVYDVMSEWLQYGLEFWGGAYDTLIKKLFVAQKYSVKISQYYLNINVTTRVTY